MSSWSTLKKVLVFGGGGLVLLFVLAGIFGQEPKKATTTTAASASSSKPLTLEQRAAAFGDCIGKIPGVKWQVDTPTVNRPSQWDALPKDRISFGDQTIAVRAGTAVYTALPAFWSSFWVADSPSDAVQAAKTLGDPKGEASASNMVEDAGRTDKYGLWSIAGQAPAQQGLGSAVEFDSTLSDADIPKLDRVNTKQIGDATSLCLKKNGFLRK
jgi:hypothetical protein